MHIAGRRCTGTFFFQTIGNFACFWSTNTWRIVFPLSTTVISYTPSFKDLRSVRGRTQRVENESDSIRRSIKSNVRNQTTVIARYRRLTVRTMSMNRQSVCCHKKYPKAVFKNWQQQSFDASGAQYYHRRYLANISFCMNRIIGVFVVEIKMQILRISDIISILRKIFKEKHI